MNKKGIDVIEASVLMIIGVIILYPTLIIFNAINSPTLLMNTLNNTPNGAASQTLINVLPLIMVIVLVVAVVRLIQGRGSSQPQF